MAAQTPPWIQPADEVASTARGLALGMQMGSEQAAQRFQEQQMMRKEQEDAMAKAQWEAEYGMKAAEVARKHTAMQEYQQRIRNGEDPLKVILDVGPSIGIGGQAEAAAIRAQNQKPAPSWSLIPGLPAGIQALQSSAGGIHVLPTAKPSAQWQDVTKNGMAGQQETTTGRFLPFRHDMSGVEDMRKQAEAEKYAKEIDTLVEKFGHTGDLVGEGGMTAKNDAMKAQYKYAKSRIDSLKAKIDALESGGTAPASGPSVPSAGAAPGIKILNIRPAGQSAPRGPAAPTPIPPPWPADEGMGAPPIPPPPQAPMERVRPPMAAPPMAPPPAALPPPAPVPAPQAALPTPTSFEVLQSPPEKPLGRKVRMGGAEVYESGIDKVARELSNRLRPLPDDALLKVAKRLGLSDAWVRDGDFFIGKGGKRVDDELSRSDFIDAIVKSSIAKNVSPLD